MLEAPAKDALVGSLNDKINAEKQKARDNLRKLMEAKKEAKEADRQSIVRFASRRCSEINVRKRREEERERLARPKLRMMS